MMKQVETKLALMQSKTFKKAYAELKELLQESEFWFIDSLEYFSELVPVTVHDKYKVKFGELWIVLAEQDIFQNASQYGFAIVEKDERKNEE
jgi:hypothetical protein